MYGNRRRISGEHGKELLRRRGELLERSFAHAYETGGLRRVHLRGRENILKRGLQGTSADALLAFLRLWIAVLARTEQESAPLPALLCSRAAHIEFLISLAAM